MPKTLHLQAQEPGDLARAADLLRNGGLVAFPTETVYGLGADALTARSVARIFEAKGRPSWDPLIVHFQDAGQVAELTKCGEGLRRRVQALAAAFWPGPLTLLLPRNETVPDLVTAARPLVGCRVPAHPVALALLKATGRPLAAPSANRFGHTSPTTAKHVLADLDGRIDAVLNAGPCAVGVESTVLDPTTEPMVLYRSGAVTPDALAAAAGVPVQVFAERVDAQVEAEFASLPSPGVGLRHYAPDVAVRLAPPNPEGLQDLVNQAAQAGARVGVMLPLGWPEPALAAVVQPWGAWAEAAALASGLFAGLRVLESSGVDVIVCPLPESGSLRDAIRDRLFKAARPA